MATIDEATVNTPATSDTRRHHRREPGHRRGRSAHVPADDAPPTWPTLALRGRTAQPAWEALGYDGRARVLRRMQTWVVDNADR